MSHPVPTLARSTRLATASTVDSLRPRATHLAQRLAFLVSEEMLWRIIVFHIPLSIHYPG
jgi:hypothetical protein